MSSITVKTQAITPSPQRRPTIVVKPRSGWQAINLSELWRFRDLLIQLTLRDVSIRYKQAVLGVLWAIIQPITNTFVFTVFFGYVMGAAQKMQPLPDGRIIPYAIFALSGTLFWQFFASAVTQSSGSLVANARLLEKVYLPRLIIPISAVGAPLADFLFAFAVLLAAMWWYSVAFHVQLALLPVFLACAIVAALGVGVLLSALTVAYRDFRFVVPFMVSTWFFSTPIVWPMQSVPQRFRWVLYYNPMVGPIEAFRGVLWGTPIPWVGLATSAAVAALVCIVGLFYFARMERLFADIA